MAVIMARIEPGDVTRGTRSSGVGNLSSVLMGDGLGVVVTKAEALEIWARGARKWPSTTSPWRPSPGDIAIYRRLLSEKAAGGRVVILGTTPELRDLLAELGAAPLLVDMSPDMYRTTSSLLCKADPSQETWIEADWCEARLPENSFDLVIGDMIWWGVSVAMAARAQ